MICGMWLVVGRVVRQSIKKEPLTHSFLSLSIQSKTRLGFVSPSVIEVVVVIIVVIY